MNYRRPTFHLSLADIGGLCLIVALVVSLKHLGLVDPLERMVIDVFAATEPARPANHTLLFDIDDTAYHGPFKSTSPLDHELIGKLIIGAWIGGARAVAVDIDTDALAADKAVAAILETRAELAQRVPVNSRAPIVWAKDAEACGHGGHTRCVIPRSSIEPMNASADRSGIALLPLDDDGAVRRYWPTFTSGTRRPDGSCDCQGTIPSLPRAAVVAAGFQHGTDADKPLLLDWRGDRFAIPRIPATQVISGFDQHWWGSSQPIRGRIVIVGGTFREARDTRWTPAGEMSGMEIMAHVIEAEATGGGLAHLSLWMAVVIEILAGLALMWLNWRFPAESRLSLLVNGVAVFVLPLAASWLLHRYALYWVNVAPVLAGVWIHQWHTRAHSLAHGTH